MSEVTAWEYYDQQQKLEKEAAEKYPWDPKVCTHHMHVDRQLLYACLTCKAETTRPLVLCYSCSIHCHSDHELVELYTKRGLTCDCGTEQGNGDWCRLRGIKHAEKSDNLTYGHNFDGKFCACDIEYTEQETSSMLQCFLGSACQEDWFHERCILGISLDEENELRKAMAQTSSPIITAKTYTSGVNMLDDIPSADELVMPESLVLQDGTVGTAKSAARTLSISESTLLQEGAEGVLKIAVTGRRQASQGNAVEEGVPNVSVGTDSTHPKHESDNEADNEANNEAGDGEDQDSDGSDTSSDAGDTLPGLPNYSDFDVFVCWKCVDKHNLRFLRDHENIVSATVERRLPPTLTSSDQHTNKKPKVDPSISFFFSDRYREGIEELAKSSKELKNLVSLFPFLTVEETPYEPPVDNEATSSLRSAGEIALRQMPHEQVVSGIEAYSMMRDKLTRFLAPFAETGKVVTKHDVDSFFGNRNDEEV